MRSLLLASALSLAGLTCLAEPVQAQSLRLRETSRVRAWGVPIYRGRAFPDTTFYGGSYAVPGPLMVVPVSAAYSTDLLIGAPVAVWGYPYYPSTYGLVGPSW